MVKRSRLFMLPSSATKRSMNCTGTLSILHGLNAGMAKMYSSVMLHGTFGRGFSGRGLWFLTLPLLSHSEKKSLIS